jgi:hypothetical protein
MFLLLFYLFLWSVISDVTILIVLRSHALHPYKAVHLIDEPVHWLAVPHFSSSSQSSRSKNTEIQLVENHTVTSKCSSVRKSCTSWFKSKSRNEPRHWCSRLFNSSYSKGRDQEVFGSKPAHASSLWDPVSKTPSTKKGLVERFKW